MGVLYLYFEPESANLFVQTLPDVQAMPTDAAPMAFTTSVRSFGYGLFSKYMLPFQLAGFLLLVSVIGIILISKRSLHADNNTKKQ
jgi:NADH:ubiquinone oxidoreductase subunit 6 (subunit J)